MKSKVNRIEKISEEIVDRAIRYELENRHVGEKFTVADKTVEKVKEEKRKEGFIIRGALIK